MLRSMLIAFAFCGCLSWGEMSAPAADERPNFLIFIADDMAWDDCGAYGHPHVRTPNLDRLAKDGMRFDRAMLTCSSCSPSRASIITGRFPHNTGAHQLHLPLPQEQVAFVELLRDAGYYTAAAGKWHLGGPTKGKFDLVVERMNQWVPTLDERPKDRPFCFWFAFTDPHRPYAADTIAEPHTAEDAVVPPYLPEVPAVREDLAAYYDEIARLDGDVGKVLATLEEQGAAENTLVVFLSDNGRPFPRCKTTVYDSGVKTPFLVRWPARVKAGQTCGSLVSSIDLAPTLLAAAGLKPSTSFQGKSFLPLLDDPGAEIRDFAFSEHNWHDFEDHQRSVRDRRFKYIRTAYPEIPQTPPADAVRSPTFQAMRALRDAGKLTREQMGCFVTPRPREELYDVEADPHELRNLADDPAFKDDLSRLSHVLDVWERETEDRIPDQRRADEFDRETGEKLQPGAKKRRG